MNSTCTMPKSATSSNQKAAERRSLTAARVESARQNVLTAFLALGDLVEAAQDCARPRSKRVLGGPRFIDKHAVETLKALRALELDLATLATGEP